MLINSLLYDVSVIITLTMLPTIHMYVCNTSYAIQIKMGIIKINLSKIQEKPKNTYI